MPRPSHRVMVTDTAEAAAIAESLRRSVLDYYARRGERLDGESGQRTLDTNSCLIDRRGRPLLEMLRAYAGISSIEGLELADLGCGFGALSVFFAGEAARVTGVDINGSRFEVGRRVGREHALAVEFMRASMQELPLPSARFDLAVMNNSLCYLTRGEERQAALSEALRILRPGGWLVARNPNRWSPVDPFTSLPFVGLFAPEHAERLAGLVGRPRSRVFLTSPRGARLELLRAGFADVVHARVPGWRPRPFDLVARYLHVVGKRPDG